MKLIKPKTYWLNVSPGKLKSLCRELHNRTQALQDRTQLDAFIKEACDAYWHAGLRRGCRVHMDELGYIASVATFMFFNLPYRLAVKDKVLRQAVAATLGGWDKDIKAKHSKRRRK